MVSKRKRKHFLNKRKREERLKRHKTQCRELAHSEYLASFKDVIYEDYTPQNVSGYRWVHNPNVADDFRPQIFQEATSSSPDDLKAPSPDAPKEVVMEYASMFTLSHFVSLEEAVKAWKTNLNRLLKKTKPGKEDRVIERWIEKKGQYVMKIDYTEESGLVGPGGDGVHKEIFLFEGVDVASLIDKTFQPYKIEIQ